MKCRKEHTHEVVENFANGKSFWYCRDCKDELTPPLSADLRCPLAIAVRERGLTPSCGVTVFFTFDQYETFTNYLQELKLQANK